MKNFRAPPQKFKKKIILLLKEALAESAELSAAFKIVRAALPAQKAVEQNVPHVQKIERYGADTQEFKAALSSIPQSLLGLIERQFGARPAELLAGALTELKKSAPAGQQSADMAAEDEAAMGDYD